MSLTGSRQRIAVGRKKLENLVVMRITPIILIGLGIWGLIAPESLSQLDENNGRLLAAIILALGCFSLWRTVRRR